MAQWDRRWGNRPAKILAESGPQSLQPPTSPRRELHDKHHQGERVQGHQCQAAVSHDPCNRFREQGFSAVLPELQSLSTMTQHLTRVCRHCMDGGVERRGQHCRARKRMNLLKSKQDCCPPGSISTSSSGFAAPRLSWYPAKSAF